MSDLQSKHFALVDAVNDAETESDHYAAMTFLRGWRDGVQDAGIKLSLLDADYHSGDRFGDVPMCCGVLLDWKPKATARTGSEAGHG